jgi:hypothetical protein
LIRNRRTKLFLLDRKFIIVPNSTQYSVHKSELLILRSLLNDEYFRNIVPFNTNQYVKNITYDIAEPLFLKDKNPFIKEISLKDQQVQENDNEIYQEEEEGKVDEELNNQDKNLDNDMNNISLQFRQCIDSIKGVIGNSQAEWRFKDAKEIYYKNDTIECSYSIIMHILFMEGQNVSIKDIKSTLINGYKKHIHTYERNILLVLKQQGKNTHR